MKDLRSLRPIKFIVLIKYSFPRSSLHQNGGVLVVPAQHPHLSARVPSLPSTAFEALKFIHVVDIETRISSRIFSIKLSKKNPKTFS